MTRAAFFVLAAAVILPALGQAPSRTYAQKLVDSSLASHPDVVILAMHVESRGNSDYPILASNIGRIGKKADEDDLRVIRTGKPNLEVNQKGNDFEVELPLLNQSKTTIGAIGIVFNYKPGDDKSAFQKKAEQVRDELREQIPSIEKLHEPVQ